MDIYALAGLKFLLALTIMSKAFNFIYRISFLPYN